MDFIVKDLDSNYRLDAFRNKAEKIHRHPTLYTL